MTRLPLRPELEGQHPYGAPQLDVQICLNVNENPYAPPPQVCQAMAEATLQASATINRYPDRDFLALREALADYLCEESGVSFPAQQVWAGNGSNEVMLHLFQAYGGNARCAMTFTPSYSMYPEYAQTTQTGFLCVERGRDFRIDIDRALTQIRTQRPSLVLLASPNNPTGTAVSIKDIHRLARACATSGPDSDTASILVIDEAYAEFRRDGVASACELVQDYTHVVVTRTMSKAFGAAGLRLGYLVAHEQVIRDLEIVRLPYHLSAITQATAIAALQHRSGLRAQVDQIRRDRDRLCQWLREQGLEVCDTDANFVLCGRFRDREAVFQALLQRSLLVRQVGPAGYLRISVGTGQENQALMRALSDILYSMPDIVVHDDGS